MYQDDIQGNATTNNPMFVDELGNVQYKMDSKYPGGKREDGSVAYETVAPTINPNTDPALIKRATDEANKMLAAHDIGEKDYDAKVEELFHDDFPYLYTDGVLFFDKDKFNLASSVFDGFELVKMTEYSYLNMKGTQRSINNIFTNGDAVRSD